MGASWTSSGGATTVIDRSPFSKLYEDAMERDADVLTEVDKYKMVFQKDQENVYWIDEDLSFIDYAKTMFNQGGLNIVRTLKDLPDPVNNVITIGPNQNYLLTGNLDLEDNELRILDYSSLIGRSQQTSRITGSSPTGVILRLEGTVILKDFYIDIPENLIGVYADGTSLQASYDWRDLNFFGSGIALYLDSINNMTLDTCGFFGPSGIYINGDIDSLIINTSIMALSESGTFGLKTDNTCLLNRRIRFSESPVFVGSGAVGVDMSMGNFPIAESVRFREINFSGPGAYLSGIDYKSPHARFDECRGIINSKRFGIIYYEGTPVKISSPRNVEISPPVLSLPNLENQKFSHNISENSLKYEGGFETFFEVTCSFAANTTTSNKIFDAYLKLNGVKIEGSAASFLTFSSNRPVMATCTAIIRIKSQDVVKFCWMNTSSGSTPLIGVSKFSMTIKEI